MPSPYSSLSTRKTPQHLPILGQNQVQNSAGGFVYQIDDWKALERFLVLGTEGGTYYVNQTKLTRDAAKRVLSCIQTNGKRVVDTVVAVSDAGRAPKNDPAIFVLALAASAKDTQTRRYALDALPKVCRIPTHLFHFLEYIKGHRGWGRTLKRAVAEWYNQMPVEKLAYELVKYQSRDGWSNADVLRKSHPKTDDEARNAVYKWAVDGWQLEWTPDDIPAIVGAFERVKNVNTSGLVREIKEFNLTREMLPTEALTKSEVWEALLEKMPYTAMLRNLGNMSKVGLLKPMSDASKTITKRLTDPDLLQKARIHPIGILIALKTYAQGHGMKGSGQWDVVPAVTDALNDAFYLAFKMIEPTGKRFLFGLDVSGSMSSPCSGTPLSCAEGAAAMALACAKSETEYYIHGFTAGPGNGSYWRSRDTKHTIEGFVDLGITPNMRLDDALRRTRDRNFGATDCAVPMLYALEKDIKVDCFVVITDSETWAGSIHPSQALKQYREKTGIPAKQVVIGMTATNFSIADPNDSLALDVSGFDASVPQTIQEFARG